jgi:hypothetical protein
MNNQKYLNILWSALLMRYSAIYVPLILVAVFSQNWPLLLPFTIYYWVICLVLIFSEKLGSYTELTASQIVERFFFFKKNIPATDIISIKDGYARGIIGNPKSLDMEFRLKNGRRGVRHILLHQFKAEDVKSFITELLKRNANIEVSSQMAK